MLLSTEKKVAIIQSNYIPWKGYFDIIRSADEFILYDDMQYTRRDWRNRNKIKTPTGSTWLTIPVLSKGNFYQPIKEIKTSDQKWNIKHWQSLKHNYNKSPFFREYQEIFEELYLNNTERYLSQINYNFIQAICEILSIKTKISWSMDYDTSEEEQTKRLVSICQQSNASIYLSGPNAAHYLKSQYFEDVNIDLHYMDYSNYPRYNQMYSGFEHTVSILDLIFNEGENSINYMKDL